MTDGPAPGGLVIVDKPPGITSHQVVARLRRLAGTRRVGHAGTLDPAATGVLVVGIDWSTRLLAFLSGHDKSYDATIRFGRSTVTDDAEGDTVSEGDVTGVTDAAVAREASHLTGDIEQVPSAVSAVKVAGQRSYALVRAGQEVDLDPRPVTVHRFAVGPVRTGGGPGTGEAAWAEADAQVDVSSGTYVRALARDLGAALGSGAHLTALRRTRSGPFSLTDAATLDVLEAEGLQGRIFPPAAAVDRFLPTLTLDDATVRAVRHGRRLPGRGTGQALVAVRDLAGHLVAVADDSGAELKLHAVAPAP